MHFDSAVDPNGAARNVDWAPQLEGRIPDPNACNDSQPYTSACTQNKPFRDPPNIFHEAFCFIGKLLTGNPEPFFGHADWMVAQYDGSIGWFNFGEDSDYDLLLVPGALPPGTDNTNRHGITKNNDHVANDKNLPQYIELEWKSGETDDAFSEPSIWWAGFKEAAQANNNEQLQRLFHPGQEKTLACGTALGLFGLDCDHGCRSELHPIYALAIQRKEDPADNQWSVLVRNWGTSGYCSQYNDELAPQSLSLVLPYTSTQPPTKVEVQEFHSTSDSGPLMPCPEIYFHDGQTIVSFSNLPAPGGRPVAAFVLNIQWPAGAQPVACTHVELPSQTPLAAPPPPPREEGPYSGRGEEYMEHLMRGLRAEQRLDLKRNLSAMPGRRAAGGAPPPPPPPPGAVSAAPSCNKTMAVITGVPPSAAAVSAQKLKKDQRKRDQDDALRAYVCHQYQSSNTQPPVGTQDQLNQACKGVK